MTRQIFFSFCFCFLLFPAFSQELDCTVLINSEKIQTTEKSVFETMKRDITNFLNGQKWTSDAFNPEERIKCTVYITLMDGNVTTGAYTATIQVQAVRPVFNTNYESTLLNYLDKDFNFQYLPSQQLYFNENSYSSNLTSMLGYYAYIILGLDYDSFSKLGGSPYFEKARNVLNAALFSAENGGWDEKVSNGGGRYWLQENLNHQLFRPFREGFYKYYRFGMDTFIENADTSRTIILDFLKGIKQVNSLKPASLMVGIFFTTNSDELINIFSKGNQKVKEEAFSLLRELDPRNSEKYLKIIR